MENNQQHFNSLTFGSLSLQTSDPKTSVYDLADLLQQMLESKTISQTLKINQKQNKGKQNPDYTQ